MKPETKVARIQAQIAGWEAKYAEAMKKARTYSAKAENLRASLRGACTHPSVKVETQYIEGGYLDRSETIYKNICTTCGKEINRRTVIGGYA